MAKRPGNDVDGGTVTVISPTVGRHTTDGVEDCTDEALSLEEILTLYSQPINEEQAWAVCYQCCRFLAPRRGAKPALPPARRIEGPGDVRIRKDGTVHLHHQSSPGKHKILPSTAVIWNGNWDAQVGSLVVYSPLYSMQSRILL